jgi:hypothetical protein
MKNGREMTEDECLRELKRFCLGDGKGEGEVRGRPDKGKCGENGSLEVGKTGRNCCVYAFDRRGLRKLEDSEEFSRF